MRDQLHQFMLKPAGFQGFSGPISCSTASIKQMVAEIDSGSMPFLKASLETLLVLGCFLKPGSALVCALGIRPYFAHVVTILKQTNFLDFMTCAFLFNYFV